MADPFRVAVITVSDKGSLGLRVDESGPTVCGLVEKAGYAVVGQEIWPDELSVLKNRLTELCDGGQADLILTTGGTGLSPRDVTPEATLAVANKIVPGLAEVMRAESLKKTARAMLSRAVAVVRGQTLIINLPGSPKGARENLEAVLPALEHGLEILTGRSGDCGRS
ncbi:MAG: MogA/MoaB family molybdenum cofactor biosynthesis protein [Deltaproteobacteria bacterium]|jgi:molybdenum cofactor synthesis domain-containing protein|nr:MogA/MoaB family molybdenum cofactor biosynthesis protein [Deltaproteobacteria bacterium]